MLVFDIPVLFHSIESLGLFVEGALRSPDLRSPKIRWNCTYFIDEKKSDLTDGHSQMSDTDKTRYNDRQGTVIEEGRCKGISP